MKRHLKPGIYVALLLCLSLNGQPLCAELPGTAPNDQAEVEREHYLLELSCEPTDRKSVTSALRAALALREDGSTVTVFIESAAVLVADPSLEVQAVEARREIDLLFDKVRRAGVAVLVCPHCADQMSIGEKSMRAGLRFTDKEELEAERERAHKIYQFLPAETPAPNAEPVAGCKPG